MRDPDKGTRPILADNVKRRRKARDWNQAQLGARSGLSQTTVSSVENGRGKSPTIKTLSAISTALDIPAWALLTDGFLIDANEIQNITNLIQAYQALPTNGQNLVIQVAAGMREMHLGEVLP